MSGNRLKASAKRKISKYGSTVVIHNDWGTPEASAVELRGYKESSSGPSTRFLFSERASIKKGSILQIRDSGDLWRVYDTEEQIVGDTLILFAALVTKIDEQGQETRPSVETQNIFNAPIEGGVQIGGSNNVQSVSTRSREEE